MIEEARKITPAAVAAIETEDLVKVYPGGVRALDGISFRVERGELFGLLGPNGAGKTTAIRILATLLRATSGSVKVLGLDVAAQAYEVRRLLGLALQTPALDAFSTGRETLELAGRLHRVPAAELRRRTGELLELMGLTSVADKLTGTYSGGMKRRLDLAAALVHRPELLVLDEPTEGLDPQSRLALWEELERINREGTTMLLTTHYMEEADRLCDRLSIIDNGSIVVEGSPEDLKRSVGADTVVLRLNGGGGSVLPASAPPGPDSPGTASPGSGDGGPDGAPSEALVAEVRRLLEGMVEPEGVLSNPGGVRLAVANASAAIPGVLRRLEGNGFEVTGLQMAQPSLDDVFLKFTGRRIREEAADQPIILGW